MAGAAFRFLHSSDWHLERPLGGVAEVPDELVPLLAEGPLKAARQVVDAALAEGVDFVVLAGDVIDVDRAGPHATVFLVEQFQRLAAQGIQVYWAGGRVDPDGSWPASIELPENVRRFPDQAAYSIVHHRESIAVARLVGRSRGTDRAGIAPRDFQTDDDGLFTIAIAHGPKDFQALSRLNVNYWALGGDHVRHTPIAERPLIHLPGTHQGRNPQEAGPHGATLVDVSREGEVHLRRVTSDVARWQHERVTASVDDTIDDLERSLRRRTEQLLETCDGEAELLIAWTVGGEGSLLGDLRHSTTREKLIAGLNEVYAHRWPRAWTIQLEADPPQSWLDVWQEQDDLRGDFLREVARYQTGEAAPPALESLADEYRLLEAAGLGHLLTRAPEEQLLQRACALGVELLSAEESD